MTDQPSDKEVAEFATNRNFRWSQGGYWINDQHGAVAPDVMAFFCQAQKGAVAAEKDALLHRIADVLSWHIAQGNIEPKNRSLEQIMQQLTTTLGQEGGQNSE